MTLAANTEANGKSATFDVRVYDSTGLPVMDLMGMKLMEASVDAISQFAKEAELEDEQIIYEVKWRQKPAATVAGKAQDGWLIFADQTGVAEALAAKIEREGGSPILFYRNEMGETNGQGNRPRYVVKSDADSYQSALAQIPAQTAAIKNIVHFWSLDIHDRGVEADFASIEADQKVGYESLLKLTQSLVKDEKLGTAQLTVVTCGAQTGVEANEKGMIPAQATVLGLGRVIAIEHPELALKLVDLDPLEKTPDMNGLYQEILGRDSDREIAFRKNARVVPRLRHFKHGKRVAVKNLVDPSASYVLTGGLGGLGLKLAGWLAKNGAKSLVLIGRSDLKPLQQNYIRQLEEKNVKVHVLKRDIASETDGALILQDLQKIKTPIKGIFHLAGVLDDGALMRQDWNRFVKVMSPKMKGAWNLHQIARELSKVTPLDFITMFSSTASLLGNSGQANYAAANAYLDAFSHFLKSKGLPATAINWGPWGEAGMASDAQAILAQLDSSGFEFLPEDVGFDVLEEVLSVEKNERLAQVGVLK